MLPGVSIPTTCYIYDGFGGSERSGNPKRCKLTEQVDEGRPPGRGEGVAAYHAIGEQTAPSAGTVIADTGAVSAGYYEVIGHVGSDDPLEVGQYIHFQHRNAANSATSHGVIVPTPGFGRIHWPRLAMAASERIRAISGTTAGDVAAFYTADIYLRRAFEMWWTHFIDLPIEVDIRDGITRTTGSNTLNWADGDEVRIPDASGTKYVVVFVVTMNFGRNNDEYKRAYLLRDAPVFAGTGWS